MKMEKNSDKTSLIRNLSRTKSIENKKKEYVYQTSN